MRYALQDKSDRYETEKSDFITQGDIEYENDIQVYDGRWILPYI